MKQRISVLLIFSLLCCIPQAMSQEPKKQQPKKEDAQEFQDNEEDTEDGKENTPEKDTKPEQKKSHSNRIFAFGAECGFNEAWLRYNGSMGPSSVSGIRAGAILQLRVYGKLHLQSGLFYAANGGNNIIYPPSTVKYSWRIHALEIPVNAIFKLGPFFFGGGPYAAYNISGKVSSGTPLQIGSDYGDAIKRFDFGLGANLGFQLNNGLLFRLRYQEGLINLQPVGNMYTYSKRASSAGVQIGYLLHARRKVRRYRTRRDEDANYARPMLGYTQERNTLFLCRVRSGMSIPLAVQME